MRIHGAYQPRPIRFLELWQPNEWRIKVYGIAYGAQSPDEKLVTAIKRAAHEALPEPAVTDSRYGLGFVCAHQGRTVSVAFVDWWENEDELHHKMFIADEPDLGRIRPAGAGELDGLQLGSRGYRIREERVGSTHPPVARARRGCLPARHLNDDV